jgi:poly(3-hydroxybutyrate) depolymerase
MLYMAYQFQDELLTPLLSLSDALSGWFKPYPRHAPPVGRFAAACEVAANLRVTHKRPPFGINAVDLPDGTPAAVIEEAVLCLPFGTLRRFRRLGDGASGDLPRVLIAAPQSGHFSTLLRETVRTFLPEHDVYITDWHNARDVPLVHGDFGLDDHIDYLVRFIAAMGPAGHVVAVCQPCVAALAAASLMAEDDHPAQPRSITLMAGPVDCRVNPTAVNQLACSRPIAWFERNLISRVPDRHGGFLRKVYPGFLQLAAFMSMNIERHRQSIRQMIDHLAEGRAAEAEAIRVFYDEYLAVNDLPAEFYLETVQRVFQRHDLARGELTWRGRRVDPAAMRRTSLMTVEGERDDICAVGQTVAAQDLCRSVRPYRRQHHVQTGVGHYGVFSGRRWSQQIYPRVRDLIHSSAA